MRKINPLRTEIDSSMVKDIEIKGLANNFYSRSFDIPANLEPILKRMEIEIKTWPSAKTMK